MTNVALAPFFQSIFLLFRVSLLSHGTQVSTRQTRELRCCRPPAAVLACLWLAGSRAQSISLILQSRDSPRKARSAPLVSGRLPTPPLKNRAASSTVSRAYPGTKLYQL